MLSGRRFGLHVGGAQGYPGNGAAIETDFEGVPTGMRERNVEHQYRPGFDISHTRGGFSELNGAVAGQQLRSGVVNEPDTHGMGADFRAPPTHPQDQVSARVDRGKLGYPDVLKQTQDRELALLIDQGVVSQDGEVEMQLKPREWR